MSHIASSLTRLVTRAAPLAGFLALAACDTATMPSSPITPNAASLDRGDDHDGGGDHGRGGAVFVTSNAATGNAVVAFKRAANGALSPLGTFPTGGLGVGGTADPLTSQFAVTLSPDHKFLFVVNAGSNDVSEFRVKENGLTFVDRVSSGGVRPVSVASTEDALYVLNAGNNTIGVFRFHDNGKLRANGVVSLPAGASGGAAIRVSPSGRFLNVTERVSNTIDSYLIGHDGELSAPVSRASAGAGPFGFDYTPRGLLVVSEAGAGAASSYTQAQNGALSVVSASVSTGGQAAPCWLIVDHNGRFAYTANAGGSSLSGFSISNTGALTLITPGGRTGDLGTGAQPLDLDISSDSRFIYVMKNGTGTVGAFSVHTDGTLTALPDTPGLVAGAGFMGLVAY